VLSPTSGCAVQRERVQSAESRMRDGHLQADEDTRL
jgi:hypothetical protein